MNNIRLFFKESLSINFRSKLDKSQSHYLSKVMRINEGQNFSLFNGSGEWEAKIDLIDRGIVNFIIQKKLNLLLVEIPDRNQYSMPLRMLKIIMIT